MTLAGLALVLLVGLAGPLLATPTRFRVPVVVGEIMAGVLVGRTGLGWVHPEDRVLNFLAAAGFALVMLVAGSHLPVRDSELRSQLRRGLGLALGTGVLAVPVGFAIAAAAGTGHALLYAVLLSSSSAALVMPVIDGAGLTGNPPGTRCPPGPIRMIRCWRRWCTWPSPTRCASLPCRWWQIRPESPQLRWAGAD